MIFFSLRMETEGQKYFLNLQKCAKDIATRIPAKSRNTPILFQVEFVKYNFIKPVTIIVENNTKNKSTIKEVSCLKVSFFCHISTQKINPNFKLLLSYWSTGKIMKVFEPMVRLN